MPDHVDGNSCGTAGSLWLNGAHPTVEDGVVTHGVCGSWVNNCWYIYSDPIKVKACPGVYYVYEFVKPTFCSGAYCADPCYKYTALDDPWRSPDYQYSYIGYIDMCDRDVNWVGWYRLFINGQSAQMPDTCVDASSCGTAATLWLNGTHPTVEDGVVTRDVCGNWVNNCCTFQSKSIKVKACSGGFYVYEFVGPNVCNLAYCADPCYKYTALDDPWRSPDYQYSYIGYIDMCDRDVNWVGWYRLFINGQSAQMPDTCVDASSCGTAATLWLNGTHPTVEDGVVTRDVCGNWVNNCCTFQSKSIKVKACSGGFYVYEFVGPNVCNLAYCAEDIVGLRAKLSSFSDLTDTGNVQVILQQIKQELVKYGLPNSVELKLGKVQKIKP
ncbi:hypothetical protein Q8A67_020195 [Cirrhinus molitorella]|uniref:UMOD/GP2/OIT3-like D8C domain-containing protein n=1 Tax=Cirrhinus molitorella TaxID=172907 RepID=A0AA88P4U5_9TELE|nr:hypothetical protein Q8A67_020195 [Cirrhinus molitorella]